MKLSISREAQPRRRRSIYHLALGVLMLLACTLTACEKTPQVGVGTQEPAKVRVVNNCDKIAFFKVSDDKGSYIYEEVQPRSKGGPWKLADLCGTALIQDSLEVDILVVVPIMNDDIEPHTVPIYSELIHFDPLPQHVFTILPDYTVEYTLMMANP